MVVVLLLPCSQSAVQLMNYLITSLLPAQILPKLDFSDGVPDDCLTLVGVPCLLLNEAQVHRLVDDLEVRFLGNHDPNIHFALLSDLPDAKEASQEDDPLLRLCAEGITRAQRKIWQTRPGIVLASAPSSRLQPSRASVDGLGAQARQTAGPEQTPARMSTTASRSRSAIFRILAQGSLRHYS